MVVFPYKNRKGELAHGLWHRFNGRQQGKPPTVKPGQLHRPPSQEDCEGRGPLLPSGCFFGLDFVWGLGLVFFFLGGGRLFVCFDLTAS